MAARNNPATGSKSDKLWRDALMRAVKRRDKAREGNPQYLEVIAEKCVKAAVDGDMGAVKEIGDRIDGRPTQALAGDPDAPIYHEVRRVIVDSQDSDG